MQCKLVPSICSYCGTGCGVLFEVIDGKIVSTLPMKTHPVNEGKLCIKGITEAGIFDSAGRGVDLPRDAARHRAAAADPGARPDCLLHLLDPLAGGSVEASAVTLGAGLRDDDGSLEPGVGRDPARKHGARDVGAWPLARRERGVETLELAGVELVTDAEVPKRLVHPALMLLGRCREGPGVEGGLVGGE